MRIKGYIQRKTQSMLVYAALIAMAAASLVVIATYVRRSVMGKTKESADTFGSGVQYNPGGTSISDSSPGQPYGTTSGATTGTTGTSGSSPW